MPVTENNLGLRAQARSALPPWSANSKTREAAAYRIPGFVRIGPFREAAQSYLR
jgi:hypothetical protein